MKSISTLENLLKKSGDPLLAQKQSDYMRGLFSFFGITKPDLKEMGKSWMKNFPLENESQVKEVIEKLWEKEEREFHYIALDLCTKYKKLFSHKMFPTLEMLVLKNSWWDSVDDLASNHIGGIVKKYPELLKKMDAWIDHPNFWMRRVALLFQLKWKEETDEKRLYNYIRRQMDEKEFFIRKAIGWALREYSKTNAESVAKFLLKEKKNLSPLSFREGAKYTHLGQLAAPIVESAEP